MTSLFLTTLLSLSGVMTTGAGALATPQSRAPAEVPIRFFFKSKPVLEVIEYYAGRTGQKIVIDDSVRGNVTILNPKPILPSEAFNQISISLASQGFSILKKGDVLHVLPTRSAQRDGIEVVTQLPTSAQPERLMTYVRLLQFKSGEEINRQLRLLPSRDGEMVVSGNKLIFTDWTSNLKRIEQILSEVDQPQATAMAPPHSGFLEEPKGSEEPMVESPALLPAASPSPTK